MNRPTDIISAIAEMEAEIKALTAQGLEQGSVQATGRKNRYRLAWWENGKLCRSKTLAPAEVAYYRVAHQRWRRVQFLKRKLNQLSKLLEQAS